MCCHNNFTVCCIDAISLWNSTGEKKQFFLLKRYSIGRVMKSVKVQKTLQQNATQSKTFAGFHHCREDLSFFFNFHQPTSISQPSGKPGGTFRFSRVSMVWHHLIQLTFASLHFQLLLNIPRSNLKSRGDRAFSFVAPNWRNNRSFHIKATHSLSRFKTLLKTYLFLLAISSSWAEFTSFYYANTDLCVFFISWF